MEQDILKVLFTEDEIRGKVAELGGIISADYAGQDLLIVGILKGSVVFLSDLVRAIKIPLKIDFMEVSSYGNSTETSGRAHISKDLSADIEGKHVLIVEDIIDTGLTLKSLVENLQARKPAGIKICTLLNKPSRRKAELRVDYNGYDIPDEFVVGYGLDYSGKYRNLPYVAVLKPEAYK